MRQFLNEITSIIELTDSKGNKRKFTIDECIGSGASCLVYHGIDDENMEYIIKECYPKDLNLLRDESGNIIVPDCMKDDFDQALCRFEKSFEQQKSLRLNEDLKNFICNVQGYFYGNNTEYIGMTCFSGRSYDRVQEKSVYDLMRRMKTLARVIGHYHKKNLLHLDIKPNNILVRPDNETVEDVMLFDFDSVTDFESAKMGKNVSYTKSWAAAEQLLPYKYQSICAATDIFSVGEIIFYKLFDRHSNDFERLSIAKYDFDRNTDILKNINPKAFFLLEDLLHHTICLVAEQRYQNTDALIEKLDKIIDVTIPQALYITKKLPSAQNFFIGRDTEINTIHRLLQENHILFLRGIGGIGKSELAKQYAIQYSDCYHAINFVPYVTDIKTMLADDNAVSIYNFSLYPEEKEEEYRERKLRKLHDLCDEETLIIIDNLDCTNDPDLDKLLKLNCKIIVTTRRDFSGFGQGQQLCVDALRNHDDIFKIFCYHYKERLSEEDCLTVEEIIKLVDGHTMTVELIAKQIVAEWATPIEILNKLKNSGIMSIGDEAVDKSKDGQFLSQSAFSHISALFDLSVFKNGKENERYVLNNLSLMPHTGIDKRKFADWCELNDHGGKTVINNLVKSGWVRENDEIISLHPVVADLVTAKVKEEGKIDLPILKNITKYIESDSFAEMYDYKKTHVVKLLLYVSANIVKANLNVTEAVVFLYKAEQVYRYFGYLNESKKYLEKALEMANDIQSDSEIIADILCSLGEVHEIFGDFEKALKYYQKSVAVGCKVSQEYSKKASSKLQDLLKYQEIIREAENRLVNAIKLSKAKYGKNSGQVSDCYNELGDFYCKTARFSEAEELFLKELDIKKRFLGRTHYAVAGVYRDLGMLYTRWEKLDKAEFYFSENLSVCKKIHTMYPDRTAAAYTDLGIVYRKKGDFKKAEKCYIQAISIQKDLHIEKDEHLATMYSNLATLYAYLNKFKESKECYIESLNIYKKLYGEKHSKVANVYKDLGILSKMMGEYKKAEEYFIYASDILHGLKNSKNLAIAINGLLAELHEKMQDDR